MQFLQNIQTQRYRLLSSNCVFGTTWLKVQEVRQSPKSSRSRLEWHESTLEWNTPAALVHGVAMFVTAGPWWTLSRCQLWWRASQPGSQRAELNGFGVFWVSSDLAVNCSTMVGPCVPVAHAHTPCTVTFQTKLVVLEGLQWPARATGSCGCHKCQDSVVLGRVSEALVVDSGLLTTDDAVNETLVSLGDMKVKA